MRENHPPVSKQVVTNGQMTINGYRIAVSPDVVHNFRHRHNLKWTGRMIDSLATLSHNASSHKFSSDLAQQCCELSATFDFEQPKERPVNEPGDRN